MKCMRQTLPGQIVTQMTHVTRFSFDSDLRMITLGKTDGF